MRGLPQSSGLGVFDAEARIFLRKRKRPTAMIYDGASSTQIMCRVRLLQLIHLLQARDY